jgi:hypothetical protein
MISLVFSLELIVLKRSHNVFGHGGGSPGVSTSVGVGSGQTTGATDAVHLGVHHRHAHRRRHRHHRIGPLARHRVPNGESTNQTEEFAAKLSTANRVDDGVGRRAGEGQRVQRQPDPLSDLNVPLTHRTNDENC